MQPRRRFVDFIILYYGNDNGQPQRDENDKRDDKGLHVKEKYTPRKVEYKRDGIDKKRVVFFRGIASEYNRCANAH